MTVQLADADEEFEDVSTEVIELGPEASTGLRASDAARLADEAASHVRQVDVHHSAALGEKTISVEQAEAPEMLGVAPSTAAEAVVETDKERKKREKKEAKEAAKAEKAAAKAAKKAKKKGGGGEEEDEGEALVEPPAEEEDEDSPKKKKKEKKKKKKKKKDEEGGEDSDEED